MKSSSTIWMVTVIVFGLALPAVAQESDPVGPQRGGPIGPFKWDASAPKQAIKPVESLEAAAPETSEFLVFDAMAFIDKPDTGQYGLEPISMVYAGALWPKGVDRFEPHEPTVRSRARALSANADQPACLDVEHWKLEGPSFDDDLRKLIDIVTWFKEERPEVKVGYYLLLPKREYWVAQRGSTSEWFRAWETTNSDLAPLGEAVDVIYPSLYTFYDNPEGWRSFAIENLKQAKQYGKPVYAFLWPQYHPSNSKLGYQFVDGDFWRMQLDVCRENADGIVIWGHRYYPWDESAAWWRKTLEFLGQVKGKSFD